MSIPAHPSHEQVKKVQKNLKNMQALNDQIYNFGLAKYMNAFALLTEQDNDDLGLTIGLNVVEGAFWAVGSVAGPAGSFFASFLSGMLVYWATDPPASINTAFSQNVLRFQATTEAVDSQLAVYASDVDGHWNDSFTYNGTTYALSDLAGFDFPDETSTGWKPMLDAALVGVDRALWTALLVANYVVTTFYAQGDGTVNGASLFTEDKDQNSPPVSWAQGFYASEPAFYATWYWYVPNSNDCCDPTCWAVTEYNIGTGVTMFSNNSLSNAACAYIFIDSTPGQTINANGLFKRQDVFTTLGITQKIYYVPVYGTGERAGDVSVGFLRALKNKQTLGQLVAREGRAAVERRILERARADAFFAHDLRMRPRPTLEKFLGVKIPEVISVNVMQELPWSFGLVIPTANWEQPAGSGATGGATVKGALDQFFAAVPRAASPASLTAVYQIVLSGPAGGDWVLRVDNGKVTVEKGRVKNPDVTLSASDADWAAMTAGKLDGLQAFFLGKLGVDGDLVLARKLRDVFPGGGAGAQAA